jgi:hypothetical protein
MFPLLFVHASLYLFPTPNKLTEDECETQDHNTEDSNTDVQTDTVQNTTTVEIHNTTQEGESTTDDIEQSFCVLFCDMLCTPSHLYNHTENAQEIGICNTQVLCLFYLHCYFVGYV